MGEIRIWNFWRNISGLLQRSVLVKGTSPSNPDQERRDWQVVGFGEEQIVVFWKDLMFKDVDDDNNSGGIIIDDEGVVQSKGNRVEDEVVLVHDFS